MVLLDTNIFIYLAKGILDASLLGDEDIAFASVTKIEALGYPDITVAEQSFIEALFAECEQIQLEEHVVGRAIRVRQQTKIRLGDAIIAASALEYDLELWTANVRDFAGIEDLKLRDPLKS